MQNFLENFANVGIPDPHDVSNFTPSPYKIFAAQLVNPSYIFFENFI